MGEPIHQAGVAHINLLLAPDFRIAIGGVRAEQIFQVKNSRTGKDALQAVMVYQVFDNRRDGTEELHFFQKKVCLSFQIQTEKAEVIGNPVIVGFLKQFAIGGIFKIEKKLIVRR